MLIMKAMDGPKNFPIDVDSRREVAAYMAETSSIRKVGYLWCGDDNEGIPILLSGSVWMKMAAISVRRIRRKS